MEITYYICYEIKICFHIPCLASGFINIWLEFDKKSGTNYLLIVVGRPIADETPTKRTAGFFPTLSTK